MPILSTNTYQSYRWFSSCPGDEDYPDVCNVEEGPRREGCSRAQEDQEGVEKDPGGRGVEQDTGWRV